MAKKAKLFTKITLSVFAFCIIWSLSIALLGAINLLPLGVEFSVGYTTKAIRVGETHYVVPVEFASRVQIYDKSLNFEKSVWVNSEGGNIDLYPENGESFWVYTARNNKKMHINLNGEKVTVEKYQQLPKTVSRVTELSIPPPSFLALLLTNYGLLWGIAMISIIVSYFSDRKSK